MMLSKSDYLLYLKHPAWLWLKKHDKDKLPIIDDNTQAIFDAGNIFEGYAEKHFENGIRLGFSDYASYLALPEQTLEALLSGVRTIFQGRFLSGQITCICDVIDLVGAKTIDLYEIKSSTRAKPEHIIDLAFQVKVIEDSGFKVRNISLIHVNNEYVRDGDIDSQQLSKITNVTHKVREKAQFTLEKIDAALTTMQMPEVPNLSPSLASKGAFGEWLEIFKSLNHVSKSSIYYLGGLNASNVTDFERFGITSIQSIPDNYKLSPKQVLQVQATKLDQQLIQIEPIREYIRNLQYPLYFLDYETLAGIVPAFDGLRPYQQVPFQYSLHILDGPEAELRHVEYLHRETTNPCEPLSSALRNHVGEVGSVVVWNESFEKKCNSLLAQIVPEHSGFFKDLNDRIVDLMTPFANGWFVDKKFFGSSSIKSVLPVIAPKLSYKSLGIREGASAQRLWMQSVIEGKDHIDQDRMFADLVEYCKLDTLAMVLAFNVLKKYSG